VSSTRTSITAVDHALAIEDAGEDPDRWLVIGPDHAGSLLEAGHVQEAAATMTGDRVYGHTRSGQAITDIEVGALQLRPMLATTSIG
jgi:hypothetical protein